MAKVDGEVNLVRLRYIEKVLVLVHVEGHELVADLGRMFSRIHETELFVTHLLSDVGLPLEVDLFRFNSFLPSDLVEALSEQNYEGHDSLVKRRVGLLRDLAKVQGE